jgi:DNA-binding transcriptional LysR family regulator
MPGVHVPAAIPRKAVARFQTLDLVQETATNCITDALGSCERRRGLLDVSGKLEARICRSDIVLKIASRWMFAPELESGEVKSVLDQWTLPLMDLWVIYPSGRLTSAKARAFVKWFEKIVESSGG